MKAEARMAWPEADTGEPETGPEPAELPDTVHPHMRGEYVM